MSASTDAIPEHFLETLRIRDFGCIRNLTLSDLKPINALIGPNDSGKSMVLRAIRTACQFGGGSFDKTADAPWSPFDPEVERLWPAGSIQLSYAGGYSYEIVAETPDQQANIIEAASFASHEFKEPRRGFNSPGFLKVPGDSTNAAERMARRAVHEFLSVALRPPPLVRLSADILKRPSRLIPSNRRVAFFNDSGSGLAAVYDAISNRNLDGFLEIRERVRELFPTIRGIGFQNVTDSAKQLEFELVGGARVPAHLMSEGLLYYLAFAALPELEPTSLLLVEEPENGLHPARLVEVVRLLRRISERTQVILTTHSPLVVNELEPDEVRVITRDPALGTRSTLMRDTPNFSQRSDVYALGELWLNYADGSSEAALVNGGPRP
jgi:ABC-type uncharacterized transport system ATPase subunit